MVFSHLCLIVFVEIHSLLCSPCFYAQPPLLRGFLGFFVFYPSWYLEPFPKHVTAYTGDGENVELHGGGTQGT